MKSADNLFDKHRQKSHLTTLFSFPEPPLPQRPATTPEINQAGGTDLQTGMPVWRSVLPAMVVVAQQPVKRAVKTAAHDALLASFLQRQERSFPKRHIEARAHARVTILGSSASQLPPL